MEMAAARQAEVVAEFTETESGRKNDRPQLQAAMAMARETGAAIAVAKLDRLARDAEFVLRLSNEAQANGMGGFLFADLPEIDATSSAGRMMLTVMASVAEFEARRISERTTDALQAAKERGQALGAQNPAVAAANSAKAAKAVAYAKKLAPLVLPMRERGDSLRTIAEALTAAGTPTTESGRHQVVRQRREAPTGPAGLSPALELSYDWALASRRGPGRCISPRMTRHRWAG